MRTKPPCKKNGIDCPRRDILCRVYCPDWKEYEEAHKAEKEQHDRNRADYIAVNDFMAKQNKRVSEKRHYEYNRKYQMTHRRNDNT